MLRAFAAFSTTAMVRVPGQDPDNLKRILDAGAQAVMIPMIETAEQAASCSRRLPLPPFRITRLRCWVDPSFGLWRGERVYWRCG